MDDSRFDQDYTAPRYTRHHIEDASLQRRPPSGRSRNPSHRNNTQQPTDEDLEPHLSPHEFLPTLPPHPPSPSSTTSQSLSSTRDSTFGTGTPLSQLPLRQNQQISGSYSLRPITGLQVQDKTSNVARPSRTIYRMPDIRAGGLAPTRGTLLSSNTDTSHFTTSITPWRSPGGPQESSFDTGSQSQARVNSLQLSLPSRRSPAGYGSSGFAQPTASNFDDPFTHENTAKFTFEYGVPATATPPHTQLQGPDSPTISTSSSPSATVSTQLGRIRPRDPNSDLAHYETVGPLHSPDTSGQAIISDHNSDVLARPNKKSRNTKSISKPTNQPRQSYQNKPPSQLGHYRAEAYNFIKTFRYIASALMLAKNPFPNPQERRKMFEEAWTQAEKVQPLEGSATDLTLDDDLMKLATDAQKSFRNRIKQEAEGAVNDMGEVFGIVPKNTIPKREVNPIGHAAAIQSNMQISALSRTNANLVFRQWQAQDEPRQGPFKNPAIERVLLVAFRSIEAEGAKGFYLFEDKMPAEAIALACTAIDVGLEEYSQGVHNKIDFTAISYRSKWNFYLNEWTRLRNRDRAAQDYTERIQSELARKAAIACGKISAPVSLPAAIRPDDILE
ncbi:hypothetical protein M407DRAFT_5554 [Tulasnella calospora MUT 4182]|uniref:DUF6532 domain-containing protein n=1 Tax=Tulasnella calospora MUT 4182 TaxID=1051891 RepID=A0A0C3QQ99_9AGAM|nr:hypothetical protein M407DRAFT_5554 [Tulasnella calospora MUT 4182]